MLTGIRIYRMYNQLRIPVGTVSGGGVNGDWSSVMSQLNVQGEKVRSAYFVLISATLFIINYLQELGCTMTQIHITHLVI